MVALAFFLKKFELAPTYTFRTRVFCVQVRAPHAPWHYVQALRARLAPYAPRTISVRATRHCRTHRHPGLKPRRQLQRRDADATRDARDGRFVRRDVLAEQGEMRTQLESDELAEIVGMRHEQGGDAVNIGGRETQTVGNRGREARPPYR